MTREKHFGAGYWRSLQSRETSHDEAADSWREFADDVEAALSSRPSGPEGPDPTLVPPSGLSRRRFFSTVGASAALAGVTGCVRKPRENILPFSERPEDMIPGKPMMYATAVQMGTSVEGLLVESQDGRPTKIEGNPKHPGSGGATSVWTQATVLEIYDTERTRVPLDGTGKTPPTGEETHASSEWGTAREELRKLFDKLAKAGGAKLGIVTRWLASPTQRAQVAALRERFPQVRVFLDDGLVPTNAFAAAEAVGGKGARAFHALDKTAIVFSADSDFLHTEPDSVRMQREWGKTRKIVGSTDFMSRLYVVEPHLTNTGVMADHRRRVKGSAVGDVMIALVAALAADESFKLPAGADVSGLPQVQLDRGVQELVAALAADLLAPENRGRSAILVGERQPAWVHVLGLLVDVGLGNSKQGEIVDPAKLGTDNPTQGSGSLRWRLDTRAVESESLVDLAAALDKHEIDHLVCLETNPAYSGSGDLGLAKKLETIGLADKSGKHTLVHIGLFRDETARLAHWHLPVSHFLEAWGDVEAIDGTTSIQQPLIDPLHDTYSATELLGFFATGKMVDGYSLLKGFWGTEAAAQFSDRIWRQWLHDGIVTGIPREPVLPKQLGWGEAIAGIARSKPIDGLEVNLHIDPRVLDGRFVANAWLQELPHPVTKVTWDNAAYMSPKTAAAQGVANMDTVTLTVDGRSVTTAVWIVPGQAEDTISIGIGYGQIGSSIALEAGVDVNPLRSQKAPWFAAVTLAKAGGTYAIACTQDYGSMKPPSYAGFDFPERPIVLERTREEFKADPNFVEKANLMERSRLQHLWDPPKLTGKQQWGMSIDLNSCVGCNACVIACQAENNIPTVGKEQVLRAREMHWMRIDRYFRGSEDEPTAVVQPMACQHCEAAPCETVCPVAATSHSPEGLNDMTYNRCIGTRYCSNNCPYKVRRFNYLAYNTKGRTSEFWNPDVDGAWLTQMQKNPDVTVRFRGVMEKCTYCIQRIQEKKIEAHVAGRDLVEDGKIVTACQQVCPSEAIVFGDIRDPDSKVSKAKRSPRDYQVLRDLNNHPRTTYLARIRNPNPDLAKSEENQGT